MALHRTDMRAVDADTTAGTKVTVAATLTRTAEREVVFLLHGCAASLRVAVCCYDASGNLCGYTEHSPAMADTIIAPGGACVSQTVVDGSICGTEVQIRILGGVPAGIAAGSGYDIYCELRP